VYGLNEALDTKLSENERLKAEIAGLNKEIGTLTDSLGNDKQQALNTLKEEMLEKLTRKTAELEDEKRMLI
jgi:hypothetical protein